MSFSLDLPLNVAGFPLNSRSRHDLVDCSDRGLHPCPLKGWEFNSHLNKEFSGDISGRSGCPFGLPDKQGCRVARQMARNPTYGLWQRWKPLFPSAGVTSFLWRCPQLIFSAKVMKLTNMKRR
jgi:hypothetical protein